MGTDLMVLRGTRAVAATSGYPKNIERLGAEPTLDAVLSAIGWTHEAGSTNAQGCVLLDAAGARLGQLTAADTWRWLRELGVVDCACAREMGARVDLGLRDGRVLRGAAVHGAGGVARDLDRVLAILRSPRFPKLRVYTHLNGRDDDSIELDRVEVIGCVESRS